MHLLFRSCGWNRFPVSRLVWRVSRLVALHPSICHFWSLTPFGLLLRTLFGVVGLHRLDTTMAPNKCTNQNLQNLAFVIPVPRGHRVDGLPPPSGGASWLPGTPLVATRLWPISGFEARAPGSSRHPGPAAVARATTAERK